MAQIRRCDLLRLLSVWLLLSLFIFGCKPRIAPSKLNNVSLERKDPGKEQSYLDPRVLPLNKWAYGLMNSKRNEDDLQVVIDEYFEAEGVKDPEPLSRYRIALRVSEDCFASDSIGDHVAWERHTEVLKQQIQNTALFVVDFHKASLGRPSGAFSFREVEICPASAVGGSLKLKGPTLQIGIQQSKANYRPFSSAEIRSLWDEGTHLEIAKPNKLVSRFLTPAQLSGIWAVFNPLGSVRRSLIDQISIGHAAVQKRLQDWALESGVDLNQTQPINGGFLENTTSVKTKSSSAVDSLSKTIVTLVEGSTSGSEVEPLRVSLTNLSQNGRLSLFVTNFLCATKSRPLAGELALTSLSIFERTLRAGPSELNLEMDKGIVALGNVYDISVHLTAGVGVLGEFIHTPVVNNTEMAINTLDKNGENLLYSRDSFNVQAAVGVLGQMSYRSLEALSLKNALTASETGVNLCQ